MTGEHFSNLLAFAGRNGPLMLFVGVLIGLVAPPLADAARPLLGLAVFVFARQPHTTSQTPSLSSSAVLTALAGSGTAAASATGAATMSPSPRLTPALTLKVALTCAVQGATATLTLKNVSALPLTWQAQPPPTLTVSPAQGALQPGQSASVQVSTVNKKTVSGTITVRASHDTLTTQDKVPCR